MRLALRIILRLEQAPGFNRIPSLWTDLDAGDFVFEVEDAPRAPDQTEPLLHRCTHVWECEAIGPFAISEQWASNSRAVTEH